MNKKKAISIITKAAHLYHDNLEDQKVLFIYGIPRDVRKQIEADKDPISGLSFYETTYHRSNFLHLTGIRLNTSTVASSIHFYEKCLAACVFSMTFSWFLIVCSKRFCCAPILLRILFSLRRAGSILPIAWLIEGFYHFLRI
ncbi:MAG: hypothetical protein K6G19_10080 [Lachnospiraceae bacterium]|nr:hypothetical protein [Lachnospiraceae bacterium]